MKRSSTGKQESRFAARSRNVSWRYVSSTGIWVGRQSYTTVIFFIYNRSHLLKMIPSEVEGTEVGKVSNLDWKVGDLVARHVKLHQLVHLPDLLRQGDEAVVVGDQALQVLEQAD